MQGVFVIVERTPIMFLNPLNSYQSIKSYGIYKDKHMIVVGSKSAGSFRKYSNMDLDT